LIAELKESLPKVHAFVGGYADPNSSESDAFDVVYCFRSTWYFPDIAVAIDFMLKMAKPGGVVLFDIMNADSEWNRHFVARKNLLFPVTILKNCIKYFLNMIWPRRWLIDTVFGVHELMYSQRFVSDFLTARGLKFEVMDLLQIEKLGVGYPLSGDVTSDQKLVFVVSKC
jgi:SAM-dependent methyltransferase